MKSILQTEKECFVCQNTLNLELHHCIHGTANRRLSDQYGLTIWLCHEHHTGRYGVHFNKDLDDEIKKMAQLGFELEYGHKKWMSIFGKNYV